VISPALLNVALHGMETAAGARYQSCGTDAAAAVPGSPVLVRYADDLAAFCHSRQQAEQVKARLATWLVSCPTFSGQGILRLIHAASCPFRYSSITSCGVR
jgi:RNA-directed DNA polymerase